MNAHILDLRETIDRLVQVADFGGVLEASKAALMDARQRHDEPLEALALLGLAQVRHYTGKFQEARVYNDGALRLARELGDPQLIMHALNIRGAIHTEIDQLAEAEDDFREALTLAYQHNDSHAMALALAGISQTLNRSSETTRAQRYAREAFEAARSLDDHYLLALALERLGNNFISTGRYEQALQCFEDALGISQREGLRILESGLIASMGRVFTESTRYLEEGLRMIEKAIKMAQDIACPPQEFLALQMLGDTYIAKGSLHRALSPYETMLNRAQEWRARSYEGIAFYQLGLVAAEQEDFDQALEYLSQALVISRETMNPYREAYIEQALGMLCALQHDYDGALNHYASARSLYDALDYGSHTREMTQRLVLTHLNRLLDRLLRFLGLRK